MKFTLYTSLQGIINLKEGRSAVGMIEKENGCAIEVAVTLEQIKVIGDYMTINNT